jgi:replicative DNA helicase
MKELPEEFRIEGVELKSIRTAANEAYEYIKKRQSGEITGFELRWKQMNRMLGGSLDRESIVVIGGRPGAGKSALSNLIVADILGPQNAHLNPFVLYWNFEMPAYKQALRTFSSNLNKPVAEITSYKKQLKEEDHSLINREINRLGDTNLYFIDVPQNVSTIENIITRMCEGKDGNGLINQGYTLVNVFDHTRLVTKENSQTEERMITELLLAVNRTRKKYKTVNIILSQLNRNFESLERRKETPFPQPLQTDLFGADSMAQFATTILILFRVDIGEFEFPYGTSTMTINTKEHVFGKVVKNRDGRNEIIILFKDDLKNNNLSEPTF